MNYDNYSDDGSCLNPVNITSNVRAPGEYKYYYCGENHCDSDKSFLSISTMWYTTKISEDMLLLSSCYTPYNTCLLYYCPKKNMYNIYIYQNTLDYKSENISLKPVQLIQLNHSYKVKDIVKISETTKQPVMNININVKVYFGADNYIILNEIDRRILLIDFINGNYVTIFNNKEAKSQEPIYNIIDTYDENYFLEGELRIRTYAFLSIKKYQEKKQSFYKYRYFIIERGILENNYFFLHSIDLEMGNGEPLGIKIAKIPKQTPPNGQGEEKAQQWFYIFCFLSSQRLFQLVTNYDKLTLYQMLRKINQCNIISVPSLDPKINTKISKCSMTTIGLKKDPSKKNAEDNKSNNDKNNIEPNIVSSAATKNPKQICFWSTSINLKLEKKQVAQSVKIFLNINTKRLCALILFFEIGSVASFPFNYNDSPEEIKNKITVNAYEIQLDKIKPDTFGPMARVYIFKEHYLFKENTLCALSSKYLILAIENKIRIFDLETNAPLYSYDFYKENIAAFLLFDDIGATFLLTWNKAFKIIFNTRYKIFSKDAIKNNPKSPLNPYLPGNIIYPIFEIRPEDVWNSYCNKLEIDSSENKKFLFKDPNKQSENKKSCVICSRDAEYYCSNCELKFYCGNEHFKYDYDNTHFFECLLVQFFRRKDIMSIEDKETRYIVLYNELIKLCGRILNYMFTRIFVGKDCHVFLEMLLNLITLLDNFGFGVNLAEFCCCNLFPSTDKNRPRPEKILFYQECIYFYVQLQILKCTFTSKCKLYNLTDCYLKIIKNDIIPKLTPKSKKKIMPLRCDKLKKEMIFLNEFFQSFQSPVFFDLKKVYLNAEYNDYVDIVENYIMMHLMALSILVKFKIKLHSSIEVNDTFMDIMLMFDDHFREIKSCKNVASYCYFSIAFYLVEIGKVPQTVKILKKMASTFSEKSDTKLKALTFYNLGVLQYALGDYKIGIHNIEVAYKFIVDCFLSEKFKHKVMVSLGLAYLNQRNLFKAYVLIQTSIRELKKIRKQKYELKCVKLNVYLNYIIDLYEYSFITKARLQSNKTKKDKNFNIHQLINFVQGEKDKELIVIEQHVTEFLKVVEYIWNLPTHILQQLHEDNPPKPSNNNREEVHHEKNLSFTMEKSQMSTFLIRETGIEKEENQLEYDEDIEVKPSLFDSLTRQQQKDFKELKTMFLKRDIILRDSLGDIEKFNINYNPVYSVQFQKIIEKLKSNFLLKDIFYCFQNEKWRDELYNYSSNSLLFGLSKYLKMEKIKNVIAIEKSKCLDIIKKEKNDLSKDHKSFNRQSSFETDMLKKINIENNIYPNNNLQNINLNNQINALQNNNNVPLFSRYKNEEMNYLQFKKKFFEALKENDKNKNDDKFQFFNLKDDYLVSLYKNVYLNNPEHDFIFQNPSLILNYIFIDISNNDTSKKEANELILKQKLQEEEVNNKTNNRKNSSFIANKNNSESIKEEDPRNNQIVSRFSPTFKNQNKSRINDINNLFDKASKMIISPILENAYDVNNYKRSSSESIRLEDYIYLKFDNIKDNLQKIKEIELNYIFVRKKVRSATSNWAGKFIPAFGKKKKVERKSCIPDIFLRFSNSKQNKNDNQKKVLNASENPKSQGHRKASMMFNPLKTAFKNEKYINDIKASKSKKKKKEKSCKNLHERLSINFNLEMNEMIEQNIMKLEQSSESEEMSQSKSSNIKAIQEKNSSKESSDEKEESNIVKIDNNFDENKKNESNLDIIKDDNKSEKEHNINILKKEDNENKISINNNNNEQVENELNNNHILNLNKDNDNKISKSNRDQMNNEDIKANKKNELIKNNTVKQFNIPKIELPLNKNNNNKVYKNLTINNKKPLAKPKTYNYLVSEQIKQGGEEEKINNFNENKKKSFYSMSQKKIGNKNYGFKNKKEQEIEIINGALQFLQQECGGNYKKNIKGNHLINSSGISISTIKHRFKFNENQINSNKNSKNNYKVPYDYKKKGKQFGEESSISFNSTSSGLFLLNNNCSYYDDESSNARNNFQEEMTRIINFNKKMKNNGKESTKTNYIYNKKMKKSESQPNFLAKKKLKELENDERTMYSKGKPLAKTNKTIKPISNGFTKYLDKSTNTGISTSKNINLSGKDINSFNNINYSKFNIKSSQNHKPNTSNSNIRLNKENKDQFYIDIFEDQQSTKRKENKKEFKIGSKNGIKKEEKNEINDENNNKIKKAKGSKMKMKNENKKDNKKDEEYNHDMGNSNLKFRFVLDKYMKSRNPRKIKREENNKKNEQENNQKDDICINSSKYEKFDNQNQSEQKEKNPKENIDNKKEKEINEKHNNEKHNNVKHHNENHNNEKGSNEQEEDEKENDGNENNGKQNSEIEKNEKQNYERQNYKKENDEKQSKNILLFEIENNEVMNNEKRNNPIFEEKINNLKELKENNENENNKDSEKKKDIEVNDVNQNNMNIFEDEKLNISDIKKKQETNSYYKNTNEKINENEEIIEKSRIESNQNISKYHIEEKINNNQDKINESDIVNSELNKDNQSSKNLDDNKNINEDISCDSSSNGLGEDSNLENKINLPINISPTIKNLNNNKLNEIYNSNNITNNSKLTNKNDLSDSNSNDNLKMKNKNNIENIMNQGHAKPKYFLNFNKKK